MQGNIELEDNIEGRKILVRRRQSNKNRDKDLQIKALKLTSKIMEAKLERATEQFLQFVRQYRYFICQIEPIFNNKVTKSFDNILHMIDDSFKVPEFHYHVIASNEKLPESCVLHQNRSAYPVSPPFLNHLIKPFLRRLIFLKK